MKISFDEYFNFLQNYYKDKKGQRYGQAFINSFPSLKIQDVHLFNLTEDKKAADYILEKFVA